MPKTALGEVWFSPDVVIARGGGRHVVCFPRHLKVDVPPPKMPREILSIEKTNLSVYWVTSDNRRNYGTHHIITYRRQPPEESGVLWSSCSLVVVCLMYCSLFQEYF